MEEDNVVEVELRSSSERPVLKLSVKLIDTYKHINKVYYEAKAQKLREQQKDTTRNGVHNDGYDDQNYDYILRGDEIMNDRYILKHKMGKGSFGQVVCAYDQVTKTEVAVKIIKSRKPFLIQAKTEIDILTRVNERDEDDTSNIVRLLDHFIYRNHQCLVFEILSFNLYELLRNTKFKGVSLPLIRKFSRHLLLSLAYLSRPDVDIIHCDLKPENILLKHPRRSAIKLIDFGSSCYLNKRSYSYIQSRFYRSPEVLLGLPYTQKIDMWSLGCVCVEMHTGEPLFGGANQADQICRIIDVLGMMPAAMLRASPERVRSQFFERVVKGGDTSSLPSTCDMSCIAMDDEENCYYILKRPNKDGPKARSLEQIVGLHSGGPQGRRTGEQFHEVTNYLEFLDFVKSMLIYEPELRGAAKDLLTHPYILSGPEPTPTTAAAAAGAGAAAATTTAASTSTVPASSSATTVKPTQGAAAEAILGASSGTGSEEAGDDNSGSSSINNNNSKDVVRGHQPAAAASTASTASTASKVRSQSAPGGARQFSNQGEGDMTG